MSVLPQAAAPGHLCFGCIKDRFLKAMVRREGVAAPCMRCGKSRKALDWRELARRVDDALQAHYEPGDDIYDGTDYVGLVGDEAGIATDIAEQMRGFLSATRGFTMAKDGEEDIYAPGLRYQERRVERASYRYNWERFKTGVRENARYFSRAAEAYLADIFTGLEEHKSFAGETVVSIWEPGRRLVRGRVAQSDEELTAILSDPASQLGPPPHRLASAGRMNAEGVAAFYGAFDVPTCRAEGRPPVGSNIVYGSFEIVRPLKILNVSALGRIFVPGSIFDPDYGTRLERAAFLRGFEDEIARPVMPSDKVFGYLPTQIVADYIGQRLELDGMTFRSVQSGRRRLPDGSRPQNIVLFNAAARVAPVDVSQDVVEVDLGWYYDEEDDGDDNITVWQQEGPRKRAPKAAGGWPPKSLPPVDPDERVPALRFVAGSLSVERVDGVDYDPSGRDVTIYRKTRKEFLAERRRYQQRTGKKLKTGEVPDLF